MREDKQDIRQRAAAAGSMCASTTLAHHRCEWCGAHTKPFTSSKGGDVEPRAAVASSSGRLPSARLPSAWCAYATASGVEREPTNVVVQLENQPGPHEEKPTLGTVPAGDAKMLTQNETPPLLLVIYLDVAKQIASSSSSCCYRCCRHPRLPPTCASPTLPTMCACTL